MPVIHVPIDVVIRNGEASILGCWPNCSAAVQVGDRPGVGLFRLSVGLFRPGVGPFYSFDSPVAWSTHACHSKTEARRTALRVGLGQVVEAVCALVAPTALDVFFALARAIALVWVHGARVMARARLAAGVVSIATLALVALGPRETLTADTVSRMQSLLNMRVIPDATSGGARPGAGALAARTAVVPRHTTRAEVTVFAAFAIDSSSVVRAVLADSATVVLSELV